MQSSSAQMRGKREVLTAITRIPACQPVLELLLLIVSRHRRRRCSLATTFTPSRMNIEAYNSVKRRAPSYLKLSTRLSLIQNREPTTNSFSYPPSRLEIILAFSISIGIGSLDLTASDFLGDQIIRHWIGRSFSSFFSLRMDGVAWCSPGKCTVSSL